MLGSSKLFFISRFNSHDLSSSCAKFLPKSHSQLAYGEEVFFKKNANRIMFSFTGDGKNLAHDELKSWLLKRDIQSSTK